MPIYVYECGSCKSEHEILQKLSDPILKDCPSCDKPSLARQVTSAGFQLKGSGWYASDFKTKSTGAAGSDVKTETTTEAKTTPAGCGGECACHP